MQTASPPARVCDGLEITLYPVTLYPARSPGYELGGDWPPKAASQKPNGRSGTRSGRCDSGRNSASGTESDRIHYIVEVGSGTVPVATCDAHTVGYTHRDRVETV